MPKTVLVILALGLLGGARTASAVSAANDCVEVSASSPAAYVEVDGDCFNVYARRIEDSFGGMVYVSAMSEWSLVSSSAFQMRGGGYAGYTVRRKPEDTRGGSIFYHEYRISSNQENGDNDITVPFGQNVIFTSRIDGGSQKSNWTVNRQSKYQTASIVFNRNWWNVPSWFIPSVDTVKPDIYYVNAHDSKRSLLQDIGYMTVVGISPSHNYETDDPMERMLDGTIYVRKGSQLSIQVFPDPSASEWPEGTPTWTGATPRTGSRDIVTVDTSQAQELEVTASCGKSKITIPIVVYECKFNLYVKSPSDNAPISFTWTPSSMSSFSPNVGHTSWKLEINPNAAKRLVESWYGADVLKYVNVCVGYYPAEAINPTGRAPGCLGLNDKSAGVSKTYDITLDQLWKGLDATDRIEDNPGTYVLGTKLCLAQVDDDDSFTVVTDHAYLSDHNCTSVCLGVMSEMGLPILSAATQWSGEVGEYYVIFEGNTPWELAKKIKEGSK